MAVSVALHHIIKCRGEVRQGGWVSLHSKPSYDYEIFLIFRKKLDARPKSVLSWAIPPTERPIVIVTNAGWDAVDAAASSRANSAWTSDTDAYGEVVWS